MTFPTANIAPAEETRTHFNVQKSASREHKRATAAKPATSCGPVARYSLAIESGGEFRFTVPIVVRHLAKATQFYNPITPSLAMTSQFCRTVNGRTNYFVPAAKLPTAQPTSSALLLARQAVGERTIKQVRVVLHRLVGSRVAGTPSFIRSYRVSFSF